MPKKAAVIGHPINHSLSPKLHNFWLKKYNIEGEYDRIDVKPEELENFLINLQKNGFSGINITIPHKGEAFKILKKIGHVTDIALRIGAVNTVSFEDGKLVATNTDSFGFMKSLEEQTGEKEFLQKNILLIGAGGAARAIAAGLVNRGVKSFIIANRTKDKAEKLNEELALEAEAISLEQIEQNLKNTDILINSTSLGMAGKEPLNIDLENLPQSSIVADIIYKPRFTKLLADAKNRGNKIVEGIDMLIYQAIPGFKFWFGKEPEVGKEERELLLSKISH